MKYSLLAVSLFLLAPVLAQAARVPQKSIAESCTEIDQHLEEVSQDREEWLAFATPNFEVRELRMREWGGYYSNPNYQFQWNGQADISEEERNKAFDQFYNSIRPASQSFVESIPPTIVDKICLDYTLASGCYQSIQEILKQAHLDYITGGSFMLKDVYRNAIFSSLFGKFWILSATLLQQRLVEFKSGNTTHNDLFADLVLTAQQVTPDPLIQTQLVWDTLGLFATQGAFMEYFNRIFARAFPQLTNQLNAFSYISLTIGVLDGYSYQNSGKMYSVPPQIHTTCNFGKPYHFWMSAYYAHFSAKQKKIDDRNSVLGAYLMGVLYEFFSDTNDRNPSDILLKDRFDVYNNIERTGIAFKAAGAYFGVKTNLEFTAKPISIDHIIETQMKRSRNSIYHYFGNTPFGVGSSYPELFYFSMTNVLTPKAAFNDLLAQSKSL